MTVRKVESLKDGAWCDGGGLWISVSGRNRSWYFRFTSPLTGRRREMGLGPAHDLSLAGARQAAAEARRLVADGTDPINQREAARAKLKQQLGVTFREVAERYILEQTPAWKDPRRADIWTSSLERLVHPLLGKRSVGEIDTDDVLAVLRPIWTTINETADRVRARMERILDYARTHGWREGENPCRWKGHLAHILPKPSAVAQVEHRPAVPWPMIGVVMASLAAGKGVSAMAVRFVCLTAVRSSEARGAVWAEIDLKEQVWTIPPQRMKTRREHRVPLSRQAILILEDMQAVSAGPASYVFPGGRPEGSLSDVALSKALHVAAGTKAVTVHGLRSAFRDWAAEMTDHPRDVAEMALGHVVSDQVEAAYRRGDLFDKRRRLMDDWGRFTNIEPSPRLPAGGTQWGRPPSRSNSRSGRAD